MIEAYKLNFRFEEPVRIAWKTFRHTSNALLLVRTPHNVGYGEATPNQFITHDTEGSVFRYLKEHMPKLPETIDLEAIKNVHERLPSGSPTARAAIDFALHDLWGKQSDEKIARLYSRSRNLTPNCITLFGKNGRETQLDVEKTFTRFPHLKVIKIKLMGKNDVERCQAVKDKVDELRKKVSFVLDCNQSYKTAAEAINVLHQINNMLAKVILVEEPVPARHWALLKEVKENIDIPMFADESAVNIDDVKTIIEKDCADGVNIKLQKAGGIWPAKVMAEECERHGLNVMVGCMFETAIGISAGIHFAQSTKNVILTDLDYDLQLPDIYQYRPTFEGGVRKLTGYPGLGVELDFDKIQELKNASKLVFEKVI